jgi:branched-subunit amino acid transport protein AzlD
MSNLEICLFSTALIIPTQLTRLFPLMLESKAEALLAKKFDHNKLSKVIFFFLIIYNFRDFSLSYEYGIRVLCGLLVMLLQFRFHLTLLSIFIPTILYILGINYL